MPNVFITGCNRGLGLELARQYVSRNDTRVFATARQPDKAVELRQLASAYPDRVEVLKLDVGNLDEIRNVADTINGLNIGLDILINNAGMNPNRAMQSFDTITPEMMLEVFQVNALAPLMLVKALAGALRKGNNPKIANVSSQVGSLEWKSGGGGYAYSTSKAALNMITRGLAGDLGRDGITTITLHPGWVQTDMGGAGAPLTVEDSASSLLRLIDRLTPADNGKFFKWNGEIHPW